MTDRSITYVRQVGNQMFAQLTDGSSLFLNSQPGKLWAGNRAVPPVGSNPGAPPTAPGTATPPATVAGVVTAAMVSAAVAAGGATTANMMWTPDVVAAMFNDAITKAAPGSFSTVNRLAALVGECAQETMWFQTVTEINGPANGVSNGYGNYYGRGFIQLTWNGNYSNFGRWMVARGVTTDDQMFVTNPDLVTTQQYAAYTAIYYFTNPTWGSNNLCWFADFGQGVPTDWHMVSRGINRGDPYSPYAAYDESLRTSVINAVIPVTAVPDSGGTGDLASKRTLVRQFALDHLRDFQYTQDLAMRNDMMNSWAGDCSSFYILCFTQTLGMARSVFGGNDSNPGYTGSLGHSGGYINSTGQAADGPMAVGDAVLYSWPGMTNGWPWDHVALYIGGGQVASHGGPGKGPVVQALSMNVDYATKVEVRRYLV